MRKNIFKMGAAALAAAVVMMMPITAKADGTVVTDSGRYGMDLVDSPSREGEVVKWHITSDLDVTFGNINDWVKNGFNGYDENDHYQYPVGYEGRGVSVGTLDMNDIGLNYISYWWDIEVAGSKVASDGWAKTDVEWRCYYDMNPESFVCKKYTFTLDYNGTSYNDCAVYAVVEEPSWHHIVATPKGYNGVIKLNIYGAKMENGEIVKDETKCLTYYIQGSPAMEAQQAAAQQPAPAAQAQQPVPAAQAQQPVPAAEVQQPVPAAEVQQPVPAAEVQQPVPAAEAQQPVPTAEVQQPVPAAEVQQPVPAAEVQQPIPTAEVQQPAPSYQGNTYTVEKGDCLIKIAKELYGDAKMWKDIYELNKGLIKDPNLIYPNMQLMLP